MAVETMDFLGNQMKFGQVPDFKSGAVSIESFEYDKPGQITADLTLKVGDVVYIDKASAVNGFYVVGLVSGDTITLQDSDFSGLSNITQAVVKKVDMNNYCGFRSLNIEPATLSSTDITTICDDYPQEEGVIQPGSISGELFWNIGEETHIVLEQHLFDQQSLFFQFKASKFNKMVGFEVAVSKYSYSGDVGDKMKAQVEFKIKSKPIYTER